MELLQGGKWTIWIGALSDQHVLLLSEILQLVKTRMTISGRRMRNQMEQTSALASSGITVGLLFPPLCFILFFLKASCVEKNKSRKSQKTKKWKFGGLIQHLTCSSSTMLFSLMPCLIGTLRETGLESLVAVGGDVGSGRSSIKRSMIHQTVRQAWKGRRNQHFEPPKLLRNLLHLTSASPSSSWCKRGSVSLRMMCACVAPPWK